MSTPFKAIKLTHESAPVEIRELIYLPEQTCRELLIDLREMLGIEEAILFSTCNRTEVYYVSEEDRSVEIIKILCAARGIDCAQPYQQYFRVINAEEKAARELFSVAMGLQSAVLGDLQISSQVKQAYSWAHDAGMAQAYLHRLMHTIFHASKRVQQETPFRDGAASLSYAAAELGHELIGHLEAPRALVIGLGEMGRDVARSLEIDRFAQVDLMNRTLSTAQALAAETGTRALPLEMLASVIGDYDLIISSVSIPDPIIKPEMLATGRSTGTYLIDLGMPRNIAPEVEEIPHAVLFNVDDIRSRTDEALERRRTAIPRVQAIVEEELGGFLEWRTQLSISPVIHQIKESLENIRKEEIGKFLKNATDQEAKMMDDVTRAMMNKIIKMPVLQLKEACKRGQQEDLAELLIELFDLDKETEKTDS